MSISEVAKREIIDLLLAREQPFYGALGLMPFLKRVWNLASMTSTDYRFKDAEGDIWQHAVNFHDWDDAYLLYQRLDLLHCDEATFLTFLEQVVHPLAIPVDQEQGLVVEALNGLLNPEGLSLASQEMFGAHARYRVIQHLDSQGLGEEGTAYEIVLSFAGEDRGYVEQVAAYLKLHGVSVFYDKYEEATLWGKDLAEHLDKVYRGTARYCVMFVSQHYKEKIWTNHERRSALAKAVQERGEYILPARFDDTEIPGLLPTLGYINLATKTPEDLGALILQKLGRPQAILAPALAFSQSGTDGDLDRRIQAWQSLGKMREAMEDWLWPEAKRAAKAAIDLAPGLKGTALTELGLWAAAIVAQQFLLNPLGFASFPHGSGALYIAGDFVQAPSASEVIDVIVEATTLVSGDVRLWMALAQMHGSSGHFAEMLQAASTALSIDQTARDQLVTAPYLALFAQACVEDGNLEAQLRQLGDLLHIQLPVSLDQVRASIYALSLTAPETAHNPNVAWFALGKPVFWTELKDPVFLTGVTIQCIDEDHTRKAHAFFLVPAPGPHRHIPSDADGVSGGPYSFYALPDEILRALDEQFLFVVQR
jgi:hypothetical protein